MNVARLQSLELGVDALQTRQQLANAKTAQSAVAWEFGDVQGHGVALVDWHRTADWGAGSLKNDADFTSPPCLPGAEII